MYLNERIVVVLLIFVLPLFGQKNKIGGQKSSKKKSGIVFSNTQNTTDYLKMLEEALSRISVSYVDLTQVTIPTKAKLNLSVWAVE